MKIHKKYSKDMDDLVPYLDVHLGKYSPIGKQNIRNKLITLALYLQNKFNVGVLEAEYDHLECFFVKDKKESINKREIRKDSKRFWYFIVNSYYETIVKRTKKSKNPFENPIPDIELLNFTEKSSSIDEQLELLMDDDAILQLKDALQIIEFYFYNEESLMMFEMCLQLLSHGGRIEEIITAKISNLNLEERFFRNFVKSKKHERKGVFYFPEWVAFHLKTWIGHLKELHGVNSNGQPKSTYLFPSINRGPNRHISKATIERKLKKTGTVLNIKAKCNPHAWRNLLNEVRESEGITPTRRALLLNQTPPGGVNSEKYLKSLKYIRKLREIYDKSTPIPEPEFLKKYRASSQYDQ